MSESKPIPRNKPEIAAATALAGELFRYEELILLEGGSGAENSVPLKIIEEVSKNVSVPVIVGGGIRTPNEAREKVNAGAKVIISGNLFEDENNWDLIPDFCSAVHTKYPLEV